MDNSEKVYIAITNYLKFTSYRSFKIPQLLPYTSIYKHQVWPDNNFLYRYYIDHTKNSEDFTPPLSYDEIELELIQFSRKGVVNPVLFDDRIDGKYQIDDNFISNFHEKTPWVDFLKRLKEEEAAERSRQSAATADAKSKKLWWINPAIAGVAVIVSVIAIIQSSQNSSSQDRSQERIDSLAMMVKQQKTIMDSLLKVQAPTSPTAPPPTNPAGAGRSAGSR